MSPRLGAAGWLRFAWRRLTAMPTALVLLLLLALAAVPGSLVPQRGADPNGVTSYFSEHPRLAPVLDALQMFDVYSSVWFSAIYLLLFVSLIGCVIPRILQHAKALRSRPPRTPVRLERLPSRRTWTSAASVDDVLARAEAALRKAHYRRERYDTSRRRSISAERGYLRETGNLVFHLALVALLIAVALGSTLTYSGQKIIVEGQTFANTLAAYDSFTPGPYFDADRSLPRYALTLDSFDVTYELSNPNAIGKATDYTASMTVSADGTTEDTTLKVNHPLSIDGTDVYLMGNGYAPVLTVRDASGQVVFSDPVIFLPQDDELTSVGVVKVPDTSTQIGMIGFFYPTQVELDTGAYASAYPDLVNPVLTLNVYTGDLGLDTGTPTSAYTLDTDGLTQVAGGSAEQSALELEPGQTVDLPNALGSVTLESVSRYISVEVHHDPTQLWVLGSALVAVAGLLTSLFVPRRRMWVVTVEGPDGLRVTVAGLARGDDPTLDGAVRAMAKALGDPAG